MNLEQNFARQMPAAVVRVHVVHDDVVCRPLVLDHEGLAQVAATSKTSL